MEEVKKVRKKKKKHISPVLVTIVIIQILLIFMLAGYLLYDNFLSDKLMIKGEWEREIDISDEIMTNTIRWMADVEGEDFSTDEIMNYLGKMNLEARLTLNSTSTDSGEAKETISKETYDVIEENVYRGLADLLSEIIVKKLSSVGHDCEGENVSVDDIVKDALGSSAYDYLKSMDIDIIPSFDELSEEYSWEGTYKINDDNSITFNFEGGDLKREFLLDEDTLILINPDEENVAKDSIKNSAWSYWRVEK